MRDDGKVHKASNLKCNITSSKAFRTQ